MVRGRASAVAAAAGIAAAAAVAAVVGAAYAQAPSGPIDAGAPPSDAGAREAAAPTAPRFGPDPKPLVTKHQWVLDLRWSWGQPELRGARRIELPKPTATPRMLGRFAVELYAGAEALDRVRFDFPLLAADELSGVEKRPHLAPPTFETKLTTSAAVVVPHSDRVTSARLVDRASGRAWALGWPPAAPDGGGRLAPVAPDAGAPGPE